jgi:hypothetical protein
MGNHAVEASPQAYARIGGALYLVVLVLGAFFVKGFVANKLIAPGDVATTAHWSLPGSVHTRQLGHDLEVLPETSQYWRPIKLDADRACVKLVLTFPEEGFGLLPEGDMGGVNLFPVVIRD